MSAIWLACAVDLFAADPYWFPHPVRFMGCYIKLFEKLVRKLCTTKTMLKTAGAFMAVSLVFLAYSIPFILLKTAYQFHFVLGISLQVFLLWTCIALRCLDKEIMKLYQSLKERNIDRARKQISYLVSRDTEKMKEIEIIKATVETAVENTSDGIIAPLFYMLLGGAPLAFAYKAINTMDSMVGYKNEKYMEFGWFPARLDDWANYIPARLTAVLMIVWAFITRQNWKNGFFMMKRDHAKSKSPNAGWPEAAAAGILDVALCGSSYYFGEIVEKESIGDSNKTIEYHDIKIARNMLYGTTVLLLFLGTILKGVIVW